MLVTPFWPPAFWTWHTHGAVNVDVNSGDAQGLVEIGNFFASHGVTGWLCSILTDTEEQTLRCIHAAREAMQASSGARLLGIHLEGPTLSGKYAGAMPPHLLQQGDLSLIRRYQEAAEGAIRSMTIAPGGPRGPGGHTGAVRRDGDLPWSLRGHLRSGHCRH